MLWERKTNINRIKNSFSLLKTACPKVLKLDDLRIHVMIITQIIFIKTRNFYAFAEIGVFFEPIGIHC